MDIEQYLQYLRDHTLEEGRAYIQEHIAELSDHAAIGNLLADEALRLLYSPFVSLKLAELLIFFGEYVHHHLSHALGLKAKGNALRGIGHHQAAMECLDTAGEEFLRLGDEVGWARTRISWIAACAWLGRVDEALQEAVRARSVLLRNGEYYWVCIIDHNAAVIYTRLGQYQKALELYERMLAIFPTLTDQSETFIKRAIAAAETNQAKNLAWLGNFEQAYQLMQQALACYIALKETGLIINAEINLADFDYAQGYYGSALRRYYQARDDLIQSGIDDPILLARLKLWMANCLVKLNRAQEACQLALEGVNVYRQLDESLDLGDALREYATMLVASGRLKEALTVLDEAWTIFNQGGFAPYASFTGLQQAELLLEMGSVAEAYNQALHLKEYFKARGLVSHSARASLVMAAALVQSAPQPWTNQEKEQQAIQEAALLCKQIVSQARRHNLQEQVYKSLHLLGRLAVLQGNLDNAVRYYQAAIVQIEHILDNLAYDLSPSFLHIAWAVYEDMIALSLQQEQVARAFNYLERARSTALHQYLEKTSKRGEHDGFPARSVPQENRAAVLQMQHELREWQQEYRKFSVQLANIDDSMSPSIDREVIQAELKRCEAKLSELFERLHLHQLDTRLALQTQKRPKRKTKQIEFAQLRRHLAPDQPLLAYFLYKDRLVIFALTPDRLIAHETPDGAAQLEHLLPLLHAHLEPAGWPYLQQPPQQVIRRLLKKLYDLLVAPVASLLPSPGGFLTIVPYGPLHKLPFHALYDGSHFLIENFQVNYLPSTNILMHLATNKSEQNVYPTDTEASPRRSLVFGYSGNGRLQRALDEAKAVAALLDGHCYLECEATIARLIEQAPGSPIIHLATHGQSRLDAPNFSYVRLADGQLNALDAFSLNLEGCELVTLSGCETGLALSGGGDEQLGLGRAFLAAGASSLVMSLWPVEENATNELMQLFYQRLLRGDTKVQALNAAQCTLLHRTSSKYTHPYFWAAFRLVGDVGKLLHNQTHPPKKSIVGVS
jgi:CHAT domain-containing protein